MVKTKTALITGISGQDGAYLSKLLLSKGYRVVGVLDPYRKSNLWGLEYVGSYNKILLKKCSLDSYTEVQKLINTERPQEIYHLAALSSVSSSYSEPGLTLRVNTLPAFNFLESIRTSAPDTQFFHPSSSEMFRSKSKCPITDKTALHPTSPYALSKSVVHQTVKLYRESYNLFAVCGILFNHESVLRKSGFFTRKLVRAALEIKAGNRNKISFGNLNLRRDFGYAPLYVEAIWKMLQYHEPRDFLICSGKAVSLEALVEHVFCKIGADISKIDTDSSLFRPNEVPEIYGDPSQARDLLNWNYTLSAFDTMDRIIDETISMDSQGIQSPL